MKHFLDELRIDGIIPVYEKKMWQIKLTIDQLVYYQLFQKDLKRPFIHS